MEEEKRYKTVFNNELQYFKKWFLCDRVGKIRGLNSDEIKKTCNNYFEIYKRLQGERKKMGRKINNIDI